MAGIQDAYDKAYRLGQQCYKQRVMEDKNPYLPVLDTIIATNKVLRTSRSVMKDIPLDRVVGTKTAGRTEAFAANFMPLLAPGSEFSDKWTNLYLSQLEEGIRDPVKVYELYGRYFVEEGNKRVSVMKYCQNPSIAAEVRTVVLEVKDSTEGELYREYLHFSEITGVDDILMTRKKDYGRLLKLVNPDDLEHLSQDQCEDLQSQFRMFETQFKKMGGKELHLTSGDAFLVYLEIFGYTPQAILPQSTLEKELNKIWPDLEIYPRKKEAAMLADTEVSEKNRILSFIKDPLKVAFIESSDPEHSAWTKEHDLAIEKVSREMGNQIMVSIFDNADTVEKIREVMDQAIAQGNEVIFTTNPIMLQVSNQYAAKYPKLKILNCSLNIDTGQLRTYYAREYELKFLMGLISGIITESNHIGYIADYPIYGTIANINAFAIGVAMTNPYAKIYLDWSTTQQSLSEDTPLDIDLLYLDGERFDPSIQQAKKFGLFDVRTGKFFPLAQMTIDWDVFYKKILKSVLNNTWKSDSSTTETESINYWWGLSNGLINIEFSSDFPYLTKRLINQFKDDLITGTFKIFAGKMLSQSGHEHNFRDGLSLNDLAKMDWLNYNIIGSVPKERQLMDEAEPLVKIHGLDKVKNEDDEAEQ